MNDAGILAIGFFIGFFICAITLHINQRTIDDRKK